MLPGLIFCAFAHLASAQSTAPPARSKSPASPQRYDSAEQTEKKWFDLNTWVVLTQSARFEQGDRSPIERSPEYMLKVIEILKARRPRATSYNDYESLRADPVEGDWFADAVRKLGLNYQEVSRAGAAASYTWKNPDGSNVVCAFVNDRLVTKAQAGLK